MIGSFAELRGAPLLALPGQRPAVPRRIARAAWHRVGVAEEGESPLARALHAARV